MTIFFNYLFVSIHIQVHLVKLQMAFFFPETILRKLQFYFYQGGISGSMGPIIRT